MAKESLISPAKPSKVVAKTVTHSTTTAVEKPDGTVTHLTQNRVEDVPEAKAEAEILAPTRPNGQEKATMARNDLAETLAQGYLDLANLLTTFATSLRASPGTIPFVQQGFAEGEPGEATEAPPPARSRISRERRGK